MDERTQPEESSEDTGGTAVSQPTTTHAEWGAGDPHLIITREGIHQTFPLEGDHARIGAGEDCELSLDGLQPLHAEIDHDDRDEYVLTLLGPASETSGSPFAQAAGLVLRSGAQFVLGPWRFVYERAEFADHGRPYGGREGGEGTDQLFQPPRPDYVEHPSEEKRD
jgi:hypothetical protein